MFKDLSKFDKICLGITVVEVIVIYGGITIAAIAINNKAKKLNLEESATREANRIKEEA